MSCNRPQEYDSLVPKVKNAHLQEYQEWVAAKAIKFSEDCPGIAGGVPPAEVRGEPGSLSIPTLLVCRRFSILVLG